MFGGAVVIFAELVGYALFLWLGLYLLVRGLLRTPLIALSVAAAFGQAAYFFAAALTDSLADPGLFALVERLTWWSSVLPLAIWFHISCVIALPIRKPSAPHMLVPRRVIAAYLVALLVVAVDACSALFNRYDAAPLQVAPGALYPIYMIYQMTMTIGALYNLTRARAALAQRHDEASRALGRSIGVLLGGAVLFIIGGLFLGGGYLLGSWFSPLVAYVMVFAGVVLLGYSVAHYGMLLGGQNIQRDFIYTLTGIVVLDALYIALMLIVTPVSVGGLLALISLVTLTHTAFDSGRTLLDRVFFSQAERDARFEAREFATALGTEPVTALLPPDEEELPAAEEEPAAPSAADAPDADDLARLKAFKNDVRKALTALKNPPRMVNSPLLTMRQLEPWLADASAADNRLARVSALRELLIAQIESLRPEDSAGPKVGEAWRFYNVLYYPYVRELSRKGALAEARRLREERQRQGQRSPGELEQVLEWLADVDEDTFYKWQRRASDSIAEVMWDVERQLG
ncbi:hypothetical protein F8S13_23945 [Chloroflexia bacterium SDU3-3]|nr:hypothetical protein F8S13_23945 [Chloroflexia bacterium SDU3-3]